jgi:hypothetical protein
VAPALTFKNDPLSANPHTLNAHQRLSESSAMIRENPDDPAGYIRRASALYALSRLREASTAIAEAQRHGAESVAYFYCLAAIEDEHGNTSAARAAWERAVELQPDAARMRFHFAHHLLRSGDFKRGWVEHEFRLRDPKYEGCPPIDLAPRWHGEDLTRKRLLVVREQGLGDTVQFAGLTKELAARRAAVTLAVLSPLVPLLRRSLPGFAVIDSISPSSKFDYQLPVLSLPYELGVDLSQPRLAAPTLVADERLVAKWRARVGAHGFKIGIVWQGSPTRQKDFDRSAPLHALAPLRQEGVRLISLQSLHGLHQLGMLPGVEAFGDEIGNNKDGVDEIAALMETLDLVVSIDTFAVHLAGGLGAPTWAALARVADWRWLNDRTDSPWYPTLRLFRQKSHGDWSAVFGDMAAALRAA